MNTVSRTVTGVATLLLGAAIIVVSLGNTVADAVVGVAMGGFFIAIGGYILFNTTEDTIEEVDKE